MLTNPDPNNQILPPLYRESQAQLEQWAVDELKRLTSSGRDFTAFGLVLILRKQHPNVDIRNMDLNTFVHDWMDRAIQGGLQYASQFETQEDGQDARAYRMIAHVTISQVPNPQLAQTQNTAPAASSVPAIPAQTPLVGRVIRWDADPVVPDPNVTSTSPNTNP